MRIIFFGTSFYCLPVLEVIRKNFELIGIVTKKESGIEKFAIKHKIASFTPKNRKELLSVGDDLNKFKPDLAVVSDYGIIIPKEIFTIPRYQTLNIHFSKLPKYRGPSPIQYTILNGEKSAWISIIIMDESMDTGDIIWQEEVLQLQGDETTPDLYRQLFSIVAEQLPGVIYKYWHKRLKRLKQLNSGATYTKPFTRQDGYIPAKKLQAAIKGERTDGLKIERAIRALSPWPGLWTIVNIPSPKRLKILTAHLAPPASQGDTLRGYQNQRLILDLVQLEGKKPVTWKQFQEGYPTFSFD